MQERLLGLDYGSKTVGVAAMDALGMTVVPVETIWRKEENKLRKTCARIEELIQELGITGIVLGHPLNMDDTAGDRAKLAESFAQMLERRSGLKVIMWDERLTTLEADEILAENGVNKKDRKKTIDQVAAVLILEDYLGHKKGEACQS